MPSMNFHLAGALFSAEDARLYHLIAEGIPNMVWTAGPDGALDYFNSRVFEYTGMTAEALRGWGWRSAIDAADRDRCEAVWRRSLATGEPYRIEFRIRRGGDGACRWHIGAALPLRDGQGRIVRWFGTCTDIDDQKRAAEGLAQRQEVLEALVERRLRALHESEQRFERFMDNNPAIAWIKDSQFRYVYVSRQYEAALGVSLAAMAGRTDFELRPAEYASRLRAGDEEVLRTGTALTLSETRLDAAGAPAQWLVVKFPLHDASGACGVAGMAIDITERHRLEEELRDRDAQASLAMETAQMAHWSWSVRDRRVTHSEGMGPLLGLDQEVKLSRARQWIAIIHPEDRKGFLAALRRSFRTGNPLYHDWRAVKPDGSIVWILISARALPDAAGAPERLVGVAMDITERRSAQRGLQRYSDRVRELLHRLVDAQETERHKLAGALHDLIGQNLTALNIGLDILKTDLSPDSLGRIEGRIDSMIATVARTIDATRDVMAGLHPAELEDYGLVPALHGQAERFRALTGIGVRIDTPEAIPRPGKAAELALFRIVQEALANVGKHSGATAAIVRVRSEGSRLTLSVEDNGRGFADPEGARTSRRGGWGLPAMRERAEAIGALLKIRFPEGGGTHVIVELVMPDAD